MELSIYLLLPVLVRFSGSNKIFKHPPHGLSLLCIICRLSIDLSRLRKLCRWDKCTPLLSIDYITSLMVHFSKVKHVTKKLPANECMETAGVRGWE